MPLKIIMVTGLPGSGKSFFASRFACKIGAEYISSDLLRKELFAFRTYSEKEKSMVYDRMLYLMDEAIRNKKDVVLDGTFYKESLRRIFLDKADQIAGKVFIIEVIAPISLIQTRLSQKREDSEADLKVYKLIKRNFEPITENHLVLESGEDTIDFMFLRSQEYINE
jgi:predicted kinase